MAKRKRRRTKKKGAIGRLGALVDAIAERVDSTTLRRAGRATAWMAVLGAGVVAWAVGVPALEARAMARESGEDVRVRFLDAPAWMNGDLEAHLVLTARQQLRSDPLQRVDLADARTALLATGWFIDVRQVRRVTSALVEIDAEFVQPYAMVRDFEGDHLIDPNGRLLPRSTPVGQSGRFIVIRGVSEPRPRRAGQLWTGDDITAALRLKRLIDTRPWSHQVVGIDTGGFADRRQLRLVTDKGHRIVWGRPPGEETAGEVDTDRKVYYLDYPFEHFGHIDGGYEGNLDITDPRGVFGR